MRRQKRISCYLPSVCRSGRNPLGEHRLQGSRIATVVTSSSMERTVDLASLGPVGRSATVSRCFNDSLLVDPVALSEGSQVRHQHRTTPLRSVTRRVQPQDAARRLRPQQQRSVRSRSPVQHRATCCSTAKSFGRTMSRRVPACGAPLGPPPVSKRACHSQHVVDYFALMRRDDREMIFTGSGADNHWPAHVRGNFRPANRIEHQQQFDRDA